MIYSRFNRFTIGMSVAAVLFFAALLVRTVTGVFPSLWIPILLVTGILVFGIQLWRSANRITINQVERKISFSNFFTKKERTYQFSELNGYSDMIQESESGRMRVIYLVKEGRRVESLSPVFYANMEELEAALKTLRYLGRRRFSFGKTLFGFMRGSIPD